MEAIHLEVLTRFACEIETQQVVILRSKSNQVTVPVELDWVYIDADHTRDAVRADIDHWRTQVKPGGLVILDDYGIRGWWDDGVRRAADEARTDGVVELLEIGGSQAVLQVVR
jgi:predicted O-methyltransferase YrrM